MLVFAIFRKFLIFFVFHITLSVLILRKWNFEVILSLNDKWVVKRSLEVITRLYDTLKLGSYCTINYGKTGNYIFWFLNVWFQADVIFEINGCILVPNPNHPIMRQIVGQRDVSKERKMTLKHCETMHK